MENLGVRKGVGRVGNAGFREEMSFSVLEWELELNEATFLGEASIEKQCCRWMVRAFSSHKAARDRGF